MNFFSTYHTYEHVHTYRSGECVVSAHSQNKLFSIHITTCVNKVERDGLRGKVQASPNIQTHVKYEFYYGVQNKPTTRSCSCIIQVCAVKLLTFSFVTFFFFSYRPVWGRNRHLFAKKRICCFNSSIQLPNSSASFKYVSQNTNKLISSFFNNKYSLQSENIF